ncbi:methyltransferase domain-containing protein [Methanoculleus sp. Afa-1]|uniref:Methyltransferase domain-containing protein n=1 Tax=Methanoculleus formosensis TaxID=2590886 RepID=A0A9E4ZJL0_9EURY|nr:class I SAM-dependent methyltransferase [Methanoculleus sp. Afa-1]MCT8337202.1 methyltransferase domain-containing protein [Methanoculleus sp. Afa-1]
METRSIDWNCIWREQRRRHHEANRDSADASFWDAKGAARRFYRAAQENNGERIEKTLRDLPLTDTSRVLDVGAGPGALAIPIARRVSHVTAVEPSEGMRSVFDEEIAAEGIGNIDVVPKRWEDVSVADDLSPPYDVVFASYSLDVPDIVDTVRKLEEASSRYVYIYWFAGETSWDAMSRELWPLLHGSSFASSPKCDILYNVLYSMGIYPNIKTFPLRQINRFVDIDEAVDHFASKCFAVTEEQKEVLRQYLERYVGPEGVIVVPGDSTRVKVWWEKADS